MMPPAAELRTPSSPPTDWADEVRALQVALDLVLSDPTISDADRPAAALRLLDLARSTAYPETAMRALEWVLGRREDERSAEPEGLGDEVERACARLLVAKKTVCPTCRRPLPDRSTLRAWAARRHLAAAWRDHLRGRA